MYETAYVPPPAPRRPWYRRPLPLVLLGGGALLTLLLCCLGVASLGESEDRLAETPISTPTILPDETNTPTIAPTPTQAPPPAPPRPQPVTVDDGVWTVGEDIPAGTYRVAEPIEGSCYWAIYRTGSNQENIIANDLPSGGRPRVTLKRGQDFETNGCGRWSKIR